MPSGLDASGEPTLEGATEGADGETAQLGEVAREDATLENRMSTGVISIILSCMS